MKSNIKGMMLQKRNSMTKQEILEKSRKISSKLEASNSFKKSKSVMFYVSFGSEVDTHSLIKKSLGKKTVIVPKIVNRTIEPSIIIDFESMVMSHPFGILEPIELMKIAHKNIDLVIVPGIAFDSNGYRIGYGYGFYDSFLKNAKKALKIGLGFDFQVVDELPREQHDVPVDHIFTEKRMIKCKRS